MVFKKIICKSLFFILISFLCRITEAVSIRVGILENVEKVTISSDGYFDILYKKNIIKTMNPDSAECVEAEGNFVKLSSQNIKSQEFIFLPLVSFIKVNGKPYRGEILIINKNDRLVVINIVDLEDYLKGVINCEISKDWEYESLKAQAIIARTWALKYMSRHKLYDVCDKIHCQVYRGVLSETNNTNKAVEETKGLVLTYEGRLILTPYHAFCGGQIQSSQSVWGGEYIPYLSAKKDFCYKIYPHPNSWNVKISMASLLEKLNAFNYPINHIQYITQTEDNKIKILHNNGNLTLTADKFRQMVGYTTIPSSNYHIDFHYSFIEVSGIGRGHGVGLCQWGMKYLASQGYDFETILQYYYPSTKLERIYD